MKAKADKLFKEAIDQLNQAAEELFRPEEDLVTYSICQNAQFSIENFLKGYLLQNGVKPDGYTSLNALLDECKAINKSFEKIDLSEFTCSKEGLGSYYCNDVYQVCHCIDTARNLEALINEEKVFV